MQYDRLYPLCTVETTNTFMDIVPKYEMYAESLNENYIFCVKSIIQVVNKSERIILLLWSGVFAPRLPSARSLGVATERKMYHPSPRLSVWETLGRLNVWFSSCQRPEWLGFEMKSVKYCRSSRNITAREAQSHSSEGLYHSTTRMPLRL